MQLLDWEEFISCLFFYFLCMGKLGVMLMRCDGEYLQFLFFALLYLRFLKGRGILDEGRNVL